MKELSLERMEQVNGGNCGAADYIGMVASVAAVALIFANPPAAGFYALAGGTITGISLGASFSCLVYI